MANEHIVPELLTSPEVAKMVSVAERTLTRWAAQGRFPRPIKIVPGPRGTVRWRRSDLMDWIDGGCKPVGGGA